jgi:4'-phosphopantetheinyl transferase
MIRLEYGQIIALDRFVILPDTEGAPQAAIPAGGVSTVPDFSISISHSNGCCLCAAVALADWPLGVDIERIEPRSPSFAADFFTIHEQRQLEESDPERRETLATAIWSGKEAALKAVRQGLRSDTRSLSCLFEQGQNGTNQDAPPVDRRFTFSQALSGRWLPFNIRWERRLERSQPPLQGWWMVDDGFVLTMAAREDVTDGSAAL